MGYEETKKPAATGSTEEISYLNLNYTNISKPLQDSLKYWFGALEKDSKIEKIPINIKTGKNARTNDASTAVDFDTAIKAFNNGDVAAIGALLTKDLNIVCVDIDGCIQNGVISDHAKEILDKLNSLTEISLSGRGIHCFVSGEVPQNVKGACVEIYSDKRFILMTGNFLPQYPQTIEHRQQELTELFDQTIKKPVAPTGQSSIAITTADDAGTVNVLSAEDIKRLLISGKNGERYKKLLEGDISDYPSQSEADLALCRRLAYFTGKNASLMDAIVRQSPLMRPKWDVVHNGKDTYGTMTLQKAIDSCNNVFKPVAGIKKNLLLRFPQLAEVYDKFEGTEYGFDEVYGLYMRVEKGKDTVEKLLAKFIAIPLREVTRDNGIEKNTVFSIIGVTQSGELLPEIQVQASKFSSLSWILDWGLIANIAPGSSVKDYVRYAIQILGSDAERIIEYTHTGWRFANGGMKYLHGAGSIPDDNIRVDLSDIAGNRYRLPSEISSYKSCLETTLKLLEIAPIEVIIPLISVAFLSPLVELFKRAGYEPSFVVWLYGRSGTKKSTLAALILSFFGSFDGKSLPSSFKDTANSLEKKGSILKDCLNVIDDFHPNASRREAIKLEANAEAILRGYGDRVGRGRMNADTSLRLSYPPRGMAIATGEDLPSGGQSSTARYIGIELKQGDIRLDILSELQTKQDQLAQTMTGFISFVGKQFDSLVKDFKTLFPQVRSKATQGVQHGRIPESIAWLYIAFNLFMEFAELEGAVTTAERKQWVLKAWSILTTIADEQSKKVQDDKPSELFLTALNDLLTSNEVYLKNTLKMTAEPSTRSVLVGYEDTDHMYLIPGQTYKAVYQYFQSQGKNFPVKKETLLRHLELDRLIETAKDSKRSYNTIKKMFESKRGLYIMLKKSAFNAVINGKTDFAEDKMTTLVTTKYA